MTDGAVPENLSEASGMLSYWIDLLAELHELVDARRRPPPRPLRDLDHERLDVRRRDRARRQRPQLVPDLEPHRDDVRARDRHLRGALLRAPRRGPRRPLSTIFSPTTRPQRRRRHPGAAVLETAFFKDDPTMKRWHAPSSTTSSPRRRPPRARALLHHQPRRDRVHHALEGELRPAGDVDRKRVPLRVKPRRRVQASRRPPPAADTRIHELEAEVHRSRVRCGRAPRSRPRAGRPAAQRQRPAADRAALLEPARPPDDLQAVARRLPRPRDPGHAVAGRERHDRRLHRRRHPRRQPVRECRQPLPPHRRRPRHHDLRQGVRQPRTTGWVAARRLHGLTITDGKGHRDRRRHRLEDRRSRRQARLLRRHARHEASAYTQTYATADKTPRPARSPASTTPRSAPSTRSRPTSSNSVKTCSTSRSSSTPSSTTSSPSASQARS
jgi:hypothetical protein